ncbi:hypothetical protein PIROE2DRAFT_19172 [Piromyces sp. E2]|nr:hypothetical protein PIROE2DRAFT_19172 [Piromyces sp. E2]|eukprot:OUM56285.1 hypothetical protein PIROE2DRAFT_19172 [Piromyces sp. E2]
MLEEEILPEFSLPLVLADTVPILFFFITTVLLARRLKRVHTIAGIIFYFATLFPLIARKKILWSTVFKRVFRMPSVIFTIISCVCSVAMVTFIFTLDRNQVYVNWIEECVNIVFQCSVCLCTLFATKIDNQVYTLSIHKNANNTKHF